MPRSEAKARLLLAALGLSTDELDDALVWARGRAAELLDTLDDPELEALLDRETVASPRRSRAPTPAPTPAEPPAPVQVAPSWELPRAPWEPSRPAKPSPSGEASEELFEEAFEELFEETPEEASEEPPEETPEEPPEETPEELAEETPEELFEELYEGTSEGLLELPDEELETPERASHSEPRGSALDRALAAKRLVRSFPRAPPPIPARATATMAAPVAKPVPLPARPPAPVVPPAPVAPPAAAAPPAPVAARRTAPPTVVVPTPPAVEPAPVPALASIPPGTATKSEPQRDPDAPVARTGTRRRAQRYSLSNPAVVRIDRMPGLLELTTRDISRHGIFIESNAPPPPDSRISVELPFPDGSSVVQLVGTVVRVVTTREAATSGCVPGFGVDFSPVSDESRRELERLLEHAKAGAAADVPRPRRSGSATQAKTVMRPRSPAGKGPKG